MNSVSLSKLLIPLLLVDSASQRVPSGTTIDVRLTTEVSSDQPSGKKVAGVVLEGRAAVAIKTAARLRYLMRIGGPALVARYR